MQLIFIFGWVLHMCDQSHPRSLRSYQMGVCENNISEDLLQYPLRSVSGLHFPMRRFRCGICGLFLICGFWFNRRADFIAQPCLSAIALPKGGTFPNETQGRCRFNPETSSDLYLTGRDMRYFLRRTGWYAELMGCGRLARPTTRTKGLGSESDCDLAMEE